MSEAEGIGWLLVGIMFMGTWAMAGLLIIYTQAKERIKKIGWDAWKKEQKEKSIDALFLAIIITTMLFLVNQYVFPIPFIDHQLNPCSYLNMTQARC